MGDRRVVAGVLGGSSSHVVQIVIAIVVVVALMAYFLLRLAGRSGVGDSRAAARPVGQHATAGATGDATVRLARTWGIGAHGEEWNIAIDGIVVGSIADKETVEIAVAPGHHKFRLESGRHHSSERSFDVSAGEVVSFDCHRPRIWPLLVAALVKPDLWIALQRE